MSSKVAVPEYHFTGAKSVYHGKVREVYDLGDTLVMVASDRISAFDHILPRPIPGKGMVLNLIAAHFLEATKDLVPNWLQAVPFPNVSVGHKCQPIRIEMVVRGYLAGHAAREYASGRRSLCGVALPEGMKENDPFLHPIITPSTKAEEGHDEDISKAEILSKGLVAPEVYATMEKYALQLFARGTEMARQRGLILVDTKYEFGLKDGELMLMDEIHTPDSSRYFILDGYEERQKQGLPQEQLSKEFVRQWLIENGFQGKEGQVMPDMSDEWVAEISRRYQKLYERLTGEKFPEINHSAEELEKAVNDYLRKSSHTA